jgi:hypothetical protein
MTFTDVVTGISGLTHYYPLTADAKDVRGTQNGVVKGATFSATGAKFNGSASIDLGDSDDFSVATNKALSIVVFLTIADWRGTGASEYVHWAGKGVAGAHEWTFRHYVKGGTGEAATRQGRTSFYHFNPAGGLGAGSYYQDSSLPLQERVIVATCDMSKIQLYVDGTLRDSDALSGYSIVPKNTTSHAMLGTRGDGTGFLVGNIRRVGFFNRSLSAAEVRTIQDAKGQADGPVTPPDPPTPPATDYHASGATDVVAKHNLLVDALHAKGIV